MLFSLGHLPRPHYTQRWWSQAAVVAALSVWMPGEDVSSRQQSQGFPSLLMCEGRIQYGFLVSIDLEKLSNKEAFVLEQWQQKSNRMQ